MLNGLDGSFFFFFDLGGGFSFPHESSETTLLQFVAVNASQQPPHIAVQEPHDGSRGQGVQLAEKDKALAHRVAAPSGAFLKALSFSKHYSMPEATGRSKVPRPPGLCCFDAGIMADAGLMPLSELSGLQSTLLLLYGGRLSFSYRCRSHLQPQQCAGILAVSVLVFGVIAAT